MNRQNYQYDIPTVDELKLSSGLSKKLKDRLREGQDATWETFLYAAGLRKAYLKNDKWDASFTKWYKDNELHRCFGNLSQFSKCASAGEVINRFGTHFKDEDHIVAALPTSMNALYEISLLIKGRSDKEVSKWVYQGGENFEDDDEEELGVISPVATGQSIKEFRETLTETSSAKSSVNKSKRKKDFNVAVATIYANKSLFAFNKKGDHSGAVDLATIKDQLKALQRLDQSQFDVRDNLTKIELKYRAKEEKADPVTKKYGAKEKKSTKKKAR